jgi:hypothetical protein
MKNLFRLGTLCVAATLVAGLSHASAIYTTYDFTADCCDDSGGPDSAKGTLVLKNYTLGDELEPSNFVSFSYSSDWVPFFSTNSLGGEGFSGVLPVDLPGPADVLISEGFFSEIINDGEFGLGDETDFGTEGIWSVAATATAVPEPSSLVMLAVGLAGLVAWRQRRHCAGRWKSLC